MRVFIDGKVSKPLSRVQWKSARKLSQVREPRGRVMNPEDAVRAQLRLAWLRGTFFSVALWIIVLISIALAVGGVQSAPMMLVITAVATLMIYAACFALVPFWKRGLEERYVDAPEVGTMISATTSELSIGDRGASWKDLSLQAVYFKSDVDDDLLLRKLTLSGAFAGVTLDPSVIENGREIVEQAFLRLCPEPAS